jgi:hypothetical protein
VGNHIQSPNRLMGLCLHVWVLHVEPNEVGERRHDREHSLSVDLWGKCELVKNCVLV